MKKMIMFLMLLFPIVMLVAQEVEPPETLVDVISNLDALMGSLLGLSFLSVWATAAVNGLLKFTDSIIRQLISWLLPIALAVVLGTLLDIGFLADKPIYTAVLYGLGAGLISNGIFDIAFVKTAVLWLEMNLFKNK